MEGGGIERFAWHAIHDYEYSEATMDVLPPWLLLCLRHYESRSGNAIFTLCSGKSEFAQSCDLLQHPYGTLFGLTVDSVLALASNILDTFWFRPTADKPSSHLSGQSWQTLL